MRAREASDGQAREASDWQAREASEEVKVGERKRRATGASDGGEQFGA
jgi:hypothetical protein